MENLWSNDLTLFLCNRRHLFNSLPNDHEIFSQAVPDLHDDNISPLRSDGRGRPVAIDDDELHMLRVHHFLHVPAEADPSRLRESHYCRDAKKPWEELAHPSRRLFAGAIVGYPTKTRVSRSKKQKTIFCRLSLMKRRRRTVDRGKVERSAFSICVTSAMPLVPSDV